VPPAVILAVDQGSSSTRCIAYDGQLRQLATASRPVTTHRPAPGMVEHDADELLAGVAEAIRGARDGAAPDGEVAAVGIANQTESFVLWDRASGRAASPVVSWQGQRAAALCRSLAERPDAAHVPARTGLALDPTFSAPKLAWLFERDPALRSRAESGELLFGDIACWLAWQLSAGAGHVTEPSNACRTLLVDLDTLAWDEGLLRFFDIPQSLLPEIRRSDETGLRTDAAHVGFEAPIAALLGDQQAALYGQGCREERMAALTLGTGAFLWLNVGATRPQPPPGVLATAAWDSSRAGRAYALEAFGANAGNAIEVMRGIGLIPAGWASRSPDWGRPHPVVVPAPSGLGTPRWDGGDRITVLAASSATTPDDLAAAALAGVAHQIADALDALDAPQTTDTVRVGGGLAADHGLLQTVADLTGLALEVAAQPQATARGIAALAGVAVDGLHPATAGHALDRVVEPRLDPAGRDRERRRWQEALDVHVRAPADA
jgi:glycerol kinase